MTASAPIPDADLWARINRDIVAKAISELAYEEAFAPVATHGGGTRWELALSGGVTYRFEAVRRIWGQLSIRPESLRRCAETDEPVSDAVAFFVDANGELGMAPDTLATYAKELYSTLVADARLAARTTEETADALAAMPDQALQCRLEGHPKAPANKGRIGWGLEDFRAYAPEFEPDIRLFWVAADRETCRMALGRDTEEETLLAHAMDGQDRARLEEARHRAGVPDGSHMLLPVHPWQWDHMIAPQFAGEIAAGRIVPLGSFGDPYRPQQSLRTLANAARAHALHVKLPITVLNTSAWRGVPGRYMAIGATLSDWLADAAASDPVLAPVKVLREVAGAFYPHPHYERIADVPYQFREMLGAIWRESPEAGLPAGHRPMMAGALAQRDGAGRPVASALVARSGLSHEAWIDRLFATVVVPLYHFMCRYGVGFIAHGQNVSVILDGDVPAGVAVKDFQGDLDLVADDFPELATLPAAVRETLKRRPPDHLVHHLQTGHFVSVLRFLSDALASHDGLDETVFYRVLADRLRQYQESHPELAARYALFDLFQPEIPRIRINRVRFAIGYGDAGERPVPALGSALANPLHSVRRPVGREAVSA